MRELSFTDPLWFCLKLPTPVLELEPPLYTPSILICKPLDVVLERPRGLLLPVAFQQSRQRFSAQPSASLPTRSIFPVASAARSSFQHQESLSPCPVLTGNSRDDCSSFNSFVSLC